MTDAAAHNAGGPGALGEPATSRVAGNLLAHLRCSRMSEMLSFVSGYIALAICLSSALAILPVGVIGKLSMRRIVSAAVS